MAFGKVGISLESVVPAALQVREELKPAKLADQTESLEEVKTATLQDAPAAVQTATTQSKDDNKKW
jgi:hypothetical protein